MEDVIAVELRRPNGDLHHVITWGRIQDRVDPAPVASLVLEHARKFGLADATGARVCYSLREAAGAPYFYEAMIDFTARWSHVDDYEAWRAATATLMNEGKELYYCGDPHRIVDTTWHAR